MKRPQQERIAFLLGVGGVIVIAVLQAVVPSQVFGTFAGLVFLLTIFAVASVGGMRPGLIATVIGVLAAEFFLIAPRFSVFVADSNDLVLLFGLGIVGVIFSVLCERLRVAWKRVEDRQQRLEAEVQERRRAELSEQARADELHVTLASIGDGVITTDIHGSCLYLNAIAERMTGWSVKEAYGQSIETVFRIISQENRHASSNPVMQVLRDGTQITNAEQAVLISRTGEELLIDESASPIRAKDGRLIGAVMIFRDVTGERAAQRSLIESENRKAAILNAALDGIVSVDHRGNVIEFNPAAERMFGYSRDQAIGRKITGLITSSALTNEMIPSSGRADKSSGRETHFLNRRVDVPCQRGDGSRFVAEVAVTKFVQDGSPLFTMQLRDVSARTRWERDRNTHLAVTQVLAQTDSIEHAAAEILRSSCQYLGWSAGMFWVRPPDDDYLLLLASWHRPDCPHPRFEEISRELRLKRGMGLPGRVWDNGRSLWIMDLKKETGLPRLSIAIEEGLRGAICCPIFLRDNFLGAFEFFSEQIEDYDEHLLELMNTVSVQIGQFIEKKWAEHQLRMSERELAEFFETATIGLHWEDEHGTILRANRAEFELLGYDVAEYLGHRMAEFHVDPDVSSDMMARLKAGERLRDFPAKLRRKDGAITDVLIDASVVWKDGRFIHARCFMRDLTELLRSERTSRFLADASAALVTIADDENTLQKVASLAVPSFADWATVDILQTDGSLRRVAVAHVDPEKVKLAHEIHSRFPEDPIEGRATWEVIRTGKPKLVSDISPDNLRVFACSEEYFRILQELGLKSYIAVPLNVRGKLLGVLSFILAESGNLYRQSDLSIAEDLAHRAAIAIENTQLYQELRQADRRKDEFLATLAHELRNPLAPIRNALHVLRLGGANSTTFEGSRQMIERQLEQMVRLVDDLMDVGRITRDKLDLRREFVELTHIIESAVETSQPLINQARHELIVKLPSQSIMLYADATRLSQVFSNLLNNSSKYTPAGGTISFVVDTDEKHAIIRVRDNGVGIPKESLPHLFELFSQVDRNLERSQGGLGIGLMLVRRLVEMHGGRVEAFSDGPDLGSEFVIHLPYERAFSTQVSAAETPSRNLGTPASLNVLVVDDNVDASSSLCEMLELMGHRTRSAEDGLAAIDAASQFDPHLILLDIGLPKLNGYDACRRIRQLSNGSRMTIVALTGWGQEKDRQNSTDAGFNLHLVKPLQFEQLEQILDQLAQQVASDQNEKAAEPLERESTASQ